MTAADFVYGIERTLRPETAAPFAFLLNKVVAGAAAYNDGSNPDFGAVGIRAIDERTLTVDLVSASPYTLNILSLWMFRAEPGWLIEGDDCTEAYGDRWAETDAFQGYGLGNFSTPAIPDSNNPLVFPGCSFSKNKISGFFSMIFNNT